MPPYSDFESDCLAHVKSVVDAVDREYGDPQLREVLINECSLDKEFATAEDGFKNTGACEKMANDLADARMLAVENKTDSGYKSFCASYYEHIGGEKKAAANMEEHEEHPEKKEEKKGWLPWWFWILLLIGLVNCCAGGLFVVYHVRKK